MQALLFYEDQWLPEWADLDWPRVVPIVRDLNETVDFFGRLGAVCACYLSQKLGTTDSLGNDVLYLGERVVAAFRSIASLFGYAPPPESAAGRALASANESAHLVAGRPGRTAAEYYSELKEVALRRLRSGEIVRYVDVG